LSTRPSGPSVARITKSVGFFRVSGAKPEGF
jgi:hypothetical protein